jgi:hypothetical protein
VVIVINSDDGFDPLVTWVKWKLVSIHLETVLILAQDRCRGYGKCTRAWKSFWPHPMELLGDVGRMEARFSLFGDNVNLDVR